MASHPLLDFIRRLRRARSVAEGGHLSDTQLLQRFAEERDEAAFEVLVWRHGAISAARSASCAAPWSDKGRTCKRKQDDPSSVSDASQKRR